MNTPIVTVSKGKAFAYDDEKASKVLIWIVVSLIVPLAAIQHIRYEHAAEEAAARKVIDSTPESSPVGPDRPPQVPRLSDSEIIGRSGFCLAQQDVANGEMLPGQRTLEMTATSLALADGISSEQAIQLLQQAKADYDAGKFSRDDCQSYSEFENNWRLGKSKPF